MTKQRNADPLRGWSEPDDELVAKALARIGDWQHRRVFFERLENPRWVEALDARGSFRAPSKTTTDPADDDWWPRWPEGEYLVRMAPMVPGAVIRIMKEASHSENPFVHQLVLQAALSLPSADAKELAPAIRSYILGGTLRDAEGVVELIEKLSDEGSGRAAASIAEAAFRPRTAEDDKEPILNRPAITTGIDPVWYDELLPSALSALDRLPNNDALATASRWLKVFQELSGNFNPTTGVDVRNVWRPAVGDHPQNTRFGDIGDALVDAVRDLGIDAVRRGRPVADVLAILEESDQPLIKRIAMHVLSSMVATSPDARLEGYKRLVDTGLLAIEYRHEYAELARSLLPLLTDEQSKLWESAILSGPPMSGEALNGAAARFQQPGERLEDAVRQYSERWQLGVLAAIEEERLPSLAKRRLTELIAKYGEVAHPDFPVYISPVTSPVSPVAPEELRSKSVDGVRDFLASWDPEAVGSSGQSRAALGQVLQLIVSERPAEFATAATTFAELNPTYVRAVLGGLDDAVRAGASVEWGPILECLSLISRRSDDRAEFIDRHNEDVLWKAAQLSAAMLVEDGAALEVNNGIPSELLGAAIDAIAPLVHHPDPTELFEDRHGGGGMDPTTLSLNTIRPTGIRVAVQLALKAKTAAANGETPALMADGIEAALHAVTSRLTPNRDESLAVAAAFGDALASLIWIDPQWASAHVGSLLTGDRYGEVVLSTALARLDPSPALLNFVTPAGEALLDRAAAGEIAASGSRSARPPVELIGDHAVRLRVQGAIPADHPLLTYFFDVAPVEARSSVLGYLGWLLMRANGVPEDVLKRAMALWDSRVDAVARGESSAEELSEFYWWVQAGKFDSSWWLPRLEQVARSQAFDPPGMVGASLEAAANSEPSRAVTVLELLLSLRDKAMARYDLVRHAPRIIAAALDSGDPAAITTAKRVMDLLGRSGHVRIAELVEQRRIRG